MRVTFSCSAKFKNSTPEMVEKVLHFIINRDTSPRHENTNIESGDDYISARLFFVDIPVFFSFKENLVNITFDSTMTGPGYHATVIALLEHMAETLGLVWDEDSIEDVTGYWQHRDFKRLQKYMTDWLISYAKSLLDDPLLQTPVRTNLVLPYAMLPDGKEYFACHILGYMNKDFFIYIQEFDEPELFSRSFFIWWNIELDAEFYLKCALSNIWCRINWLPPMLENEMLDISNVLLELEVAWRMDKSLQLPVPEWLELAKLIGDQELADELIRRFPTEINQPPSKGYCRYDILYELGDGKWQLKLPGKMHTSYDDDGSLIFWDHDERNIRISIINRRDDKGKMEPALDMLSQAMEGLSVTPHLLPMFINIPAFITHSEVKKDNGKQLFKTTLFAAMNGSMAIISIYYTHRQERQWALSICNSLMPGPKRTGDKKGG